MKKLFLWLLGITVIFLNQACSENPSVLSTQTTAMPSEIKIAAVLPLSGRYRPIGEQAQKGIEFAVDEINNIGGISGAKLKMLIIDDKSIPQETARIVQELATQTEIVAIIGGIMDDLAFAGASVANREQIVFISPMAGVTGLTEIGPYVFRNRITYAEITRFLAEYLFRMKEKRTFAILYPDDEYGISVKEVFNQRVKELNGKIVHIESYMPGVLNLSNQIMNIKTQNPQVVFVPCYANELTSIAQQVYMQGFNPMLSGIDSWTDAGVILTGKEYLEGAVFTGCFWLKAKDKPVKSFVENYEGKFKQSPDRTVAHCVDAVRILAAAIYTGGYEREKIKEGLLKIKNFPGITGKTTVLPTREVDKQMTFLTVKKGQIVKSE